MATTAELRIPVTVDGRTTVATFGQIEAAARKAAQAAADVGRGAVAGTDLVAQAQARLVAAQQELTAARQYDAQFRDAAFRAENGGIQASIAANAARARAVQAVTAAERELEQARQRATQGPSRDAGEFDQRTTRLAIQGIEDRKERQLAATRQTLQAEVEAINQIIARRQSLGELTEQQARQAREYARQLGENALAAQTSGAAREGGRSDRVAVNAQGAITSLAQGLQDASYARNIGEVARYAGNNLAQFATQAAYTATAAKATGQTLIGALAGAFTGPGGVVLAITAALSILPALITYLGRSAEAQRQAAEAAREHSAALNEQAVEIRSLTGARAAAAAQEKREQLAQLEEQLEANREAQQRLGPNGAAPILAEYDRRRANISRLPVFSFRPTEEVQLEQTAVRLRTEENRILENIDTVTGSIRVAEARATYDLGTRLALRRQEAQTLAETGANEERLAQVREEIRRDEDTLARRLQTGQYDPDTIERRAATAARTAEREAETARNRQARLGAQVAREQAALRAELAVAATREGVAREIAAAAKLRDERYAIARQDATLRLAVEAAYQRDVSRIREADERARTDRQIAALEQVAQARQQIDAAIGVGEDELAQQQIDNIRANALFAASTAADRLKGLDNIQASTADLVALIQRGTLADAEAFANRAGESEQVQRVVELTLERLRLEAELAGRARDRRLEAEAEAREDADRNRDLDARRADARRRIGSGGRGGGRTDANTARDDLARAEARLADIDLAIARARRDAEVVAAEIGASILLGDAGAVDVIAQGAAESAEVVRKLEQDRRDAADDTSEAEIRAAEAAADEVEASYERRRDAARRFADEAIQAVIEAFDYDRRFTDIDVEIARDRYRQEEEDLRESLRNREISQREFDLQMRQLAAERSEYEKEVEADRASFLEQSARGISEVILEEIRRQVAAAVAAAAVRAALGILTGGGIFAIPAFGFASGGQVVGPGSGTSDSVVARLSNGEHVLTAEEVERMGGHAAVYRLRSLALSGSLPAFATGGPVSYDLSPPPMPRVFSQTGGVSAGLDLSPLSDQIERLTRRVDAQTVALDTAVRDGATRTARSVGDPDAARRITRTSRTRTQQVQPRGTRRSL